MIDIENLTLKQIKEISNLINQKKSDNFGNELIGKYVVVRTRDSGVHIGTIIERNGIESLLKDSRRIWNWSGAFTLSEVSQNGVNKSSKLSKKIPLILLTQSIEIIPVSEKAQKIFDSIEDHNP